jgi:5-methylcytosine-specific restriction endonuclease McrA
MPRRGNPYGGAWERVRRQILKRDGYVCQIRGPHCKQVATQVDHIVPHLQGGSLFDSHNLRASCQPCNRGRVHYDPTDPKRIVRTLYARNMIDAARTLEREIREHEDDERRRPQTPSREW